MIIIEQDAQETREAFALNTNAALVGLRLANAGLSSLSSQAALGDTMSTEIDFRPGRVTQDDRDLSLGIEFTFLLRDGGSTGQELLRIACSFEVEYELRPSFAPTEEQLRAFHKGNAVFNCWPFFREFIQNMAVRMAYPPPPIPFLRLMPKRAGELTTTPTPDQQATQTPPTRRSRPRKTTRSATP